MTPEFLANCKAVQRLLWPGKGNNWFHVCVCVCVCCVCGYMHVHVYVCACLCVWFVCCVVGIMCVCMYLCLMCSVSVCVCWMGGALCVECVTVCVCVCVFMCVCVWCMGVCVHTMNSYRVLHIQQKRCLPEPRSKNTTTWGPGPATSFQQKATAARP